MAKNFLKLMKDIKPQIQESQRTSSKISIKNCVPRHVIYQLQKQRKREYLEGS